MTKDEQVNVEKALDAAFEALEVVLEYESHEDGIKLLVVIKNLVKALI